MTDLITLLSTASPSIFQNLLASAIWDAHKTSVNEKKRVDPIRRAISDTADEFLNYPNLEAQLTDWCDSDEFRNLRSLLVAGMRPKREENVVASFIRTSKFDMPDASERDATAGLVVIAFFQHLIDVLHKTPQGTLLLENRMEELHRQEAEQSAARTQSILDKIAESRQEIIGAVSEQRHLHSGTGKEKQSVPNQANIPAISAVPVPRDSFVGRHAETRQICASIRQKALVTLVGMGGIGKTRLSLRVAEKIKGDFEHGAYLVRMTSLANPTLVTREIALRLGVTDADDETLPQTLLGWLKNKSLLLVLDNCEHLKIGHPGCWPSCQHLIRDVIEVCPNVRILATSTMTFGIRGEETIKIRPLSPEEAENLFIKRAKINRADAQGHKSEIADICARLEGIPLAVELVAATIRNESFSLKTLSEQFSDPLLDLFRDDGAEMSHHRTLKALLDWSYNLLPPSEQELLTRAAVFRGGWTLSAIKAVAVRDGVSDLDVVAGQSDLIKTSFVVSEVAEERYSLLETVRHYGWDKLGGRLRDAQMHHRDYFLVLAERAEATHNRAGLLRDHENLRAALTWSMLSKEGVSEETEAQAGLRLAGALWRFWETHGFISQAQEKLMEALSRDGARTDSSSRGLAQRALGRIFQAQGEMTTALQWLVQSVDTYERVSDTKGATQARVDMGWLLMHQGRLDEAKDLYDQCLQAQMESKDGRGIASTLYNQGMLAFVSADYVNAEALYTASLEAHHDLQPRRRSGEAVALVGLGNVATNRLHWEDAKRHFATALDLYERLGDVGGIAKCQIGRAALAYYSQGEPEVALSDLDRALSILRKAGQVDADFTEGLRTWAALALVQGNFDGARVALAEALRLCHHLGDPRQSCGVLEMVGRLWINQQKLQDAVIIFGATATTRKVIGTPIKGADIAGYNYDIEMANASLGDSKFNQASADGAVLTWLQANNRALTILAI